MEHGLHDVNLQDGFLGVVYDVNSAVLEVLFVVNHQDEVNSADLEGLHVIVVAYCDVALADLGVSHEVDRAFQVVPFVVDPNHVDQDGF